MAASPSARPRYLRLPRPRERDPVFGLSRGTMNALVLPTRRNGGNPPVRSLVVRRPGAKSGVRLIDVESLQSYLDRCVEPGYRRGAGQDPRGPQGEPEPRIEATLI